MLINKKQTPIEVTSHVHEFRHFLNCSWKSLDSLMHNHDWENDGWFSFEWIQANWEFLVERELLKKNRFRIPLRHNKRITFQEKQATHFIECKPSKPHDLFDEFKETKNYNNEELMLSGFYAPRDTTYGLYPPFDYIEACTPNYTNTYMIHINECQFYLTAISWKN